VHIYIIIKAFLFLSET